MAQRIQIRRDTETNWVAANPVLRAGEFGLDTTSMKVKIGNGTDDWNTLPYSFDYEGDLQTLQTNIDGKVDKEAGKSLTTIDFTEARRDKLQGIEAGAQANTVDSVSGKTGDVLLDKADVGLDQVDNTSDLDKPVSTAAQLILDEKVTQAEIDAAIAILKGDPTVNGDNLEKLETRLSSVETLTTSDDMNLDTIQEIVDFIKANRDDLDSISLDWASVANKPDTATRWPSYAEVTDKPADYPPSAHDHDGVYQPLAAHLTAVSALTGQGLLEYDGTNWNFTETIDGGGATNP